MNDLSTEGKGQKERGLNVTKSISYSISAPVIGWDNLPSVVQSSRLKQTHLGNYSLYACLSPLEFELVSSVTHHNCVSSHLFPISITS